MKLAASYDTAETVLEGGPYDDDDTEEEGRECPVCMECFAVNDIVSWSPCAKTCDHVFHHSCIKQWLLHHECCPYCRVTVLPVDRDAASNTVNADAAAAAADDANNNATTTTYFGVTMTTSAATSSSSSSAAKQQWTVQQLAALAAKRSQRVMTTYYCLDEGLVTLDRSPSSTAAAAASTTAATKDDRKKVLAMKRFLSTGIQQGELAELRGAGSKGGNSSGRAMDDQEIVVSVQAPAQNNNSNHRDNGDADDDVVAANGGSPATVPSAVEATRGGNPPPQTLHFADAVVDIEMCLMQLRVISNDVAGGQQLGEEDEVPSSR